MRVRRTQEYMASDESGFTLVEVMIAFTILAIGLASIAVAQLSAMRTASRSNHVSQAMYLAEEQMEILRGTDWGAAMPCGPAFTVAVAGCQDPLNPIVPPLATTSLPGGGLGNGDTAEFNRSWSITPNMPPHNLSEIIVTVTWNNPLGVAQTVTLRGLRGQ